MNYKISGPVNVTRLFGNVNGINKVIYLFMDAHYDEDLQTLCSENDAIHIQKYLSLGFEKLNNGDKVYDFLVEFEPNSYWSNKNKVWYNKNIYLHEVLRFFKKYLIYDRYHNQIWMSEYFKNVRFHYLDIRRWTEYFVYQNIRYILNISQNESDKVRALEIILQMVQNLKKQFLLIKEYLSNPIDVQNSAILIEELPEFHDVMRDKNLEDKVYDKIRYLLNKLLGRYNHTEIKQIINQYINKVIVTELDNLVLKTNSIYEKFTGYKDSISSKNITQKNEIFGEIRKIINKFWSDNITPLFGQIMDIYFLRRFLDKDYITNAIVFVGAAHAAIYISILVNLFGFKITHTSISITTNMDELNKLVRDVNPLESQQHFTKTIFHVLKLLKLPKTNYIQCSDVSNFPDNFD